MGVMKREPERNLYCSETLRVRGRLLQQQIRAFPDRYTVSCDSTNGITSGFWMFLIKMRVRENNAGDGNSGTEMGRRWDGEYSGPGRRPQTDRHSQGSGIGGAVGGGKDVDETEGKRSK